MNQLGAALAQAADSARSNAAIVEGGSEDEANATSAYASPPSNPYARTFTTPAAADGGAAAVVSDHRSHQSDNPSMDYTYQQNGSFMGGAEAARRQARSNSLFSGQPTNNLRCDPRPPEQRCELPVHVVDSFERFFGSLLRSSPLDFVKDADENNSTDLHLWRTCCERVGIQVPTHALHNYYSDAKVHFSLRAALVIEEARHSLSSILGPRWLHTLPSAPGEEPIPIRRGGHRGENSTPILMTVLDDAETNPRGHTRVTFTKDDPFTTYEQSHLRSGTVFECVSGSQGRCTIDAVHLGVVLHATNEKKDDDAAVSEKETRSACLLFCRPLPAAATRIETEWVLTPVSTLLSELRQFEAMTTVRGKLRPEFLVALLGHTKPPPPKSTHILFGSMDDEAFDFLLPCEPTPDPIREHGDSPPQAREAKRIKTEHSTQHQQPPAETMFTMSTLNESQERAAVTFLESSKFSISLIQGPPGTGKTTLLVNIMCRHVSESQRSEQRRRLMICAPTNKALVVLATRFLASINHDHENLHCNVMLVGDDAKLLGDNAGDRRDATLRSIFVYSWRQNLVNEYKGLRKAAATANVGTLARRLEKRLVKSLVGLPSAITNTAKTITLICNGMDETGSDLSLSINSLVRKLKEIKKDVLYDQLLRSADVIFSTLASAGSKVLKGTPAVHDLIVDEAAAASEPAICIPLHLNPERLLLVGDPLQLPATVMSRRAAEKGLSRSLQERLMYGCKRDHVVLAEQYRMHPDISSFPSRQFYQRRVVNGSNVRQAHYGHNQVRLAGGGPYTLLQVNGVEEQV
jgi:AAA domain